MSRNTFRNLFLVVLVAITAAALGHALAQTRPAATPPPQLVTGLPDFSKLVEKVGPAVVSIEATGVGRTSSGVNGPLPQGVPELFRHFFGPGAPMPQPPSAPDTVSQGSGFIVSEDGYVLTNHHVVDGASDIVVQLSDRREYTAELVGSDPPSDVALLKIDAEGLPALRVGDSGALRPGQWVVAIGSPFGLDHSVTAGIVSAVGRSNPYANQQYVPFIQTDVAINRGNSGGPLLDTRGQVVGINSQIFSNSGGYMGVSFAIPIDMVMNVVAQLKDTGTVSRGQIGVSLQEIDQAMVREWNLPDGRGALVTRVFPGTPADQAGLRPGDVIRSFNGTRVDASSDLPPLVGTLPPGTEVTLSLLRDGTEREVSLELGKLGDILAGAAPTTAPVPADLNPLGIRGRNLDPEARRDLGLAPDEGVAIAGVDGAAARAGLRPGDVVLSVGREPVGTVSELDARLAGVPADSTVMLLVRRGGSTQFIAVTPGAQAG
ncbi:MAG TPA: DegQ family serine endoprotease [Xanthomonadaceae bacterium]|nr:DegQ family serine endoprotease [Xanthomonadaceae bacterium]